MAIELRQTPTDTAIVAARPGLSIMEAFRSAPGHSPAISRRVVTKIHKGNEGESPRIRTVKILDFRGPVPLIASADSAASRQS